MTLDECKREDALLSLMRKVKHNLVKPTRAREFKKGDQFVVCELMHIVSHGGEQFTVDGRLFDRHPFSTFPVLSAVPEDTDALAELGALLDWHDLVKELKYQLLEMTADRDRLQEIVNYRNRTEKDKVRDRAAMAGFLSDEFI